jgi:hypothetical protein
MANRYEELMHTYQVDVKNGAVLVYKYGVYIDSVPFPIDSLSKLNK